MRVGGGEVGMLIFPGWPQVRNGANRIILGECSANCSLISQNVDMLVCALVKAKLRIITDRDGEQGFVHVGEYVMRVLLKEIT